MKIKDNYTMMLESLIQSLIPSATLPVLGKVEDLVHDLALDIESFGKWFDEYIRNNNVSLQEIDLVGTFYKFITHDFTLYMQKTFHENPPELQVYCDEEDTKFTNWREVTEWIEKLKERNPKAANDGFVRAMYDFYG